MPDSLLSADQAFDRGLQALDTQQEGPAIEAIGRFLRQQPEHAQLWQLLGLLHRARDDLQPAMAAFDRAAALAPQDAKIAHGRARAYLEAGSPVPGLFEHALALAPGDEAALLGWTSALVAAGRAVDAVGLLERRLARDPAWAAGHGALARLLWMLGDESSHAGSLQRALTLRPGDLLLWREYLALLFHARRFEEALGAIASARKQAGPHIFFDAQEAACLDEAGRSQEASVIFTRLMPIADPALAVYYTRHLLRLGRPAEAATFAEQWTATPASGAFWPYLSIAWRLTGVPRWQWLEGDERLVGVYDLGLDLGSLDALSERLRTLHVLGNQPLEQSVRGGTQTDGHLFARVEPEIRSLRTAVVAAIQAFLAQLPSREPAHPTLTPARDRPVRFSGSWSVRLTGGGHHANHLHPGGWLSSALYVALPPEGERGAAQAGWLSLGQPQAELGLGLPAYRHIEPRPGRLVLFPSTMWHGTVPFDAGERLTVAFDVAPPF